jgi:hypothetical protein
MGTPDPPAHVSTELGNLHQYDLTLDSANTLAGGITTKVKIAQLPSVLEVTVSEQSILIWCLDADYE